MKRLFTGALVLIGVLSIAGLALGAAPGKGKAPAKGEEYHHLLALHVREAAEHAKALHHYAIVHREHLNKAIVTKHVDELAKNLDGVKTELASVEQSVEPAEKSKVEMNFTTIRSENDRAQTALDALKAEVAKEQPSATVIADQSKLIYTAMTTAEGHHMKAMARRGVHEPKKPPKT
jgi:FKBP-type peptidyl-prolyl cis-trans isomerase